MRLGFSGAGDGAQSPSGLAPDFGRFMDWRGRVGPRPRFCPQDKCRRARLWNIDSQALQEASLHASLSRYLTDDFYSLKDKAMTPLEYAKQFQDLPALVRPTGDYSYVDDNADVTPPFSMALPEKGKKEPSVLTGQEKWVSLDVSAYRLDTPKLGSWSRLGEGLKSALYIEAKIMSPNGLSEQAYSFQYRDIAYSLIAPFWGNGYPEECQLVLQLWDRLNFTPKFDILANQEYVGVDCNAFVGGYLERRVIGKRDQWSRSIASGTATASLTGAKINDLMARKGTYINSFEDLSPPEPRCLLLGECDPNTGELNDHVVVDGVTAFGHIAISQPSTLTKVTPYNLGLAGTDLNRKLPDDLMQITVVESTGGIGVTDLPYLLISVQKKIVGGAFYVWRGSQRGPYILE